MADVEIDPLATPPATGDRLIVITEDDHRGVLWVVAILCLIYVVILLAIRSSARRREFGWDDWVAAASAISAIVYYALSFVSITHGFGQIYTDILPADADMIGKMVIAGNVFFFVSVALTKCAIILLCRRLFSANMKRHKVICDVASGVCGIWCIASILATTVSCTSFEQLGYQTNFCTNLIPRWIGVGIADGILELLIVALAFLVVFPLQMSASKKMPVIMSFAPRLILIVLIALHVHTLDQATTRNRRGVAITNSIVYLHVQLLYAVLSAAIPALNRWLRKFDSSMGTAWQATSRQYGTANSSSGDKDKKQNTFPMNTLRSNGSANRSARQSQDEEPINPINTNFRPDHLHYSTSVSGRPDVELASNKSHESQHSEAKIIRKEQRWNVTYDYNTDTNGGFVHAR